MNTITDIPVGETVWLVRHNDNSDHGQADMFFVDVIEAYAYATRLEMDPSGGNAFHPAPETSKTMIFKVERRPGPARGGTEGYGPDSESQVAEEAMASGLVASAADRLEATPETFMEKPDLHELAARAESLFDALGGFKDAVEEAYDAALGEFDEDADVELDPGSGDDPNYFETAKGRVASARTAVAEAQGIIATVQGYRDFAESGSVPA